jgi:hypothetical protein
VEGLNFGWTPVVVVEAHVHGPGRYTTMPDYKPFTDDAELLDCAFEWLTVRARRLTLERDARDAGRDDADAAYYCAAHPMIT